MKKTAILLALIIASVSMTIAQSGSLKGVITDRDNGKGIASVSLDLMLNGSSLNSTTTNSNGEYSFNNVPVGNYILKAVATGFVEEKKKVSIVMGKTTEVSLQLSVVVIETELANLPVETTSYENTKSGKDKAFRSRNDCSKMMSGSGAVCAPSTTASYTWASPAYDEDISSSSQNSESYDVINENEFKNALETPVSTLSADVDNAAYSNIRRYLTGNSLPPKDAVRIEEMINYFNYDYAQPKDGNPFSINMEIGDCPWNTAHKLVHIGLMGQDIDQSNIPPSNLVFLLDVSGSMSSPNKLPLLKEAFKVLVEKLRPNDRVAIVVYAGAAGMVLQSTPGNQKDVIIKSLENLNAGGSTAGGQGIELAYKVAKENFMENGNNRVILATDGDFNVGASSDGDMVSLIEQKRNDGIFLTVLGFGMGNYKDSKMEKISNAGNGNYAYIDNIMEAKKVLGEEMWGTLYTIAKDVKIQIEFNPANVKAYRLIGYENRLLNKEDFNDDKKDAGEIGVGHTVTALYEIIAAGSSEEVSKTDELNYQENNVKASKDLMTVKLRYKRPESDTSKLIEKQVTEDDLKTEKLSDNFNFSAAVAEFGMLLRNSKHISNGSYTQVLQLAKNSKGKDEHGYRAEFIQLVSTAQSIHDTASKK